MRGLSGQNTRPHARLPPSFSTFVLYAVRCRDIKTSNLSEHLSVILAFYLYSAGQISSTTYLILFMKESCANSNLATKMFCKLVIKMKFLQEILIVKRFFYKWAHGL